MKSSPPTDTPVASSRRRNRPFIGGSVSKEVAAAVEAEAEARNIPKAHVIDARLRAAFGLPPEPPGVAAA